MNESVKEQHILRRFWEGWKKVAQKIGDFQARLILTLFYFFILGPFALVVRYLDPLGIRRATPPVWLSRAHTEGTLIEQARRQH